MGGLLMLERFVWFDRNARCGSFPNAARLARQFEISTKTAQRTIDFMRDRLSAPLEYDSSRKGYFYPEEGIELPHLQATQEEILAILLSRNLLSHSAGGMISREIDRFGRKLFTAFKPGGLTAERLAKGFSASWHGYSPAQGESFQKAARALLENRLLEFAYRSPAKDRITRRTVEPHHMQHYMASWVLIAFCRLRSRWRTFFLSRMEDLQIADEHFRPRPAEEWLSHIDGAFGIFQGGRSTTVVLRFTPFRARWIREQVWHPKQGIRIFDDGSLELSFPVVDLREVKMKVLQFGADVEVIQPIELREQVRDEISRTAAMYR
ncbi:MAG: WYL domain-containing protein [Desulfobacteraceae bacterium]|nr:MAG: WYL domain-containing protein [Desulfobacteraceae bacterium]